MSAPGLYWHVHHDGLYEYCYEPKRRINYVKANKPKHEIVTRLLLMKPVKGKIGEARAWAAYLKAWADYDKIWADCAKAWANYDKARADYEKALADYHNAWAARDKAGAEWQATIRPGEAEALHAKECKNCPWNGKTIFP